MNLELVAAAAWVRAVFPGSLWREEEVVEMVGKEGLLHGRQRKNGQRGRRDAGVAAVPEAKEERVSRKKGLSVTMQRIQTVD